MNKKNLNSGLEDICSMEVNADFSEDIPDVLDSEKEDGEFPNPEGDKNNVVNSREIGNDQVDEDSNRKRKREDYFNMLRWIRNVAKDPFDPEYASLPQRSMWNNYGDEHLWKQVLNARQMMCTKRNANLTADKSLANLAKRSMHPSMYEDSKKVRSSRRVIPSKKPSPKTRSPSVSSSGTRSNLDDEFFTESYSEGSVFFFLGDREHRKRVPVGPYHQANLPEWTNETYVFDSKWVGSRVWPLESGQRNKYLVERQRMCKVRQDSCGCQYQGSVECKIFHVAEKRIRIKFELGSAFYFWKFNRMGQEVALSWTKKEEERFQAVVRSNPSSMEKCFWDEIVKVFPGKKRKELVSYYFNVYLLQRRSHQNRSTPTNINSDDEDTEFG